MINTMVFLDVLTWVNVNNILIFSTELVQL